jgi:hypothetical protein
MTIPETLVDAEKRIVNAARKFIIRLGLGWYHSVDQRFGDRHEISFSAQDDDWSSSWTGRSGIPLSHFAARWDQLETRLSTVEPGSSLDRSAPLTGSSSALSLREFRELSGGRVGGRSQLGGLFGANPISQKRYVKRMAQSLLRACPGSWTKGYGPLNYGQLKEFIESPDDDFGNTSDMFCILKYRFDLLHYADMLLTRLRIPKPDAKPCFQFNLDEWKIRFLNVRGRAGKDIHHECFRQLVSNPAFRKPTKDQGKPFLHPLNYVVAAIADESKTLEAAKALLEEMRGLTNIHMKGEMKHVMRTASVRERGATWLRTIGRTLRELSPGPRRREVPQLS